MTQQDIIDKVRAIMNEAGAETTLSLLSEDTLKLNTYIESVIPDAVNYWCKNAPLQYLNTSTGKVQYVVGKQYSAVTLPADFLRLASIKIRGWNRTVFAIHPLGSEQYNILHNDYTTAGVNKPQCVFVSGNEIECFPAGTPEVFHYVKTSTAGNLNLDTLKQELFEALCYMCASLVYEIFENKATAAQMRAIAKTYTES